MTNIWKNFPSDKLQKLIGESQLINISQILPLINNEEFNENQIYKKNTLARIFEAFSGADKLLKKKFREDLYGSLNNDDKAEILAKFLTINRNLDFFVDYFDKYCLFLSKNTLNNFLKELINLKF